MGYLSFPASSSVRHVVVAMDNSAAPSEREKPKQAVIINDAIIYIGDSGFLGIKWHDEPW